MPRYNFDLAGSQSVSDQNGMVFLNCYVAGRFAKELAADLGAVRPDLCGRASVIMTDEHRTEITYCVAICSSRLDRHEANAVARASTKRPRPERRRPS